MGVLTKIKENLTIIPAFRLLIWYFIGTSIVVIFKYPFSITICSLFILTLIALVYSGYKKSYRYESCILVFAIINTLISTTMSNNHYANFLTKVNEHRDLKVRFSENFYAKDTIHPMYTARLEVVEIKENGKWQKSSGKILFVAKKPFNTVSFYKGTKLEVSGSLYKLNTKNNYERSLLYQGFTHKVNFAKIIDSTLTTANSLTRLQAKVIKQITHNIEGNKKGLLIAMYLGFKNALSYDDKTNYKNSGIMHIFAVSGLHIGIIFTILMLLAKLLFLPIRWRYLIIPLILLIYVVLVGCPASAIRAWLMLSIWSFSRLFWRPSQAINTLSLAALVIIIFDPLAYLQAGYQYSFLIVSILLLGNEYFSIFLKSLNEKYLWQSKGLEKGTFTRKISQFLLIMLIAWLASIPINLYFNYRFIPAAFFINLVLGFIVWLILFFSLLKTFLSDFFATPLNYLLDLAASLGNGDESFLNLTWGGISNLSFFSYYLVLTMAFWLPIRWYYRFILFICCMLIIFYPRFNNKSEILCFLEAGSLTPHIAYITPQRKLIMINTPSYTSIRAIEKKINFIGLNTIDTLIFPHLISQYQRGLRYTKLPKAIFSIPLNNRRTSLQKFYKTNKNWQERWQFFTSLPKGIEVISDRNYAKISFKRNDENLIIKYRIKQFQSIDIHYELWSKGKLYKYYNFEHFANRDDKEFSITLPDNFLNLL